MSKFCLAVAVFLTGFAGSALAQTLTTADRAACQADFDKFCKGTTPGGGRIIACLNSHRDQISEACKKVVDRQKKQ